MKNFIKRYREEAGLTQAQLADKMKVSTISVQNWESGKTGIDMSRYKDLAYYLNISVDLLIKESLIEADKKRKNNWPAFLFDDDTNQIIDSLHLNMAQQDLFGLLYIYDTDCLQYDLLDTDTYREALKSIPYRFIEKVGSISFMNQAEGLYKVIKYVRADFLMKVLRQNPDMEFDIRKLTKDQICEFIDRGYKSVDDMESLDGDGRYEGDIEFHLPISMKKAKIILPVLAETGVVHLSDEKCGNPPIREDIPENVLMAILDMCDFKRDLWEKGYYKKENNDGYIRHGLETVTDYYEDTSGKSKGGLMWRVNSTGQELLKWFSEKEAG